jgi:hypothetical protein
MSSGHSRLCRCFLNYCASPTLPDDMQLKEDAEGNRTVDHLRQWDAVVDIWDVEYESGREVILKVGTTQPKGLAIPQEMFNDHEPHTLHER